MTSKELLYLTIMSGNGTDGTEIDFLKERGFFTAPASTKYHGAYEGGLLDHSLKTCSYLRELTRANNLTWQRPESPFIVGMFHDLCKMDEYVKRAVDISEYDGSASKQSSWIHKSNTLLCGHGDKSVMIASMITKLTEEEVMCIRYHMGAFTDKDEWSDYTRAVKRYSNVLWTHHADMLAAHVMGV